VVAASTVFAQECRHPPPVSNYTNERYQGFWYEVGRVCFFSLKFSRPILYIHVLALFSVNES